jgi:subtilisin family serine protease
MGFARLALLTTVLTAAAPVLAAPPSLQLASRAASLDKLSGALPLQFVRSSDASVIVELGVEPTAGVVSTLLNTGARFPFGRPATRPLGRGRFVALRADVDALSRLSVLPQVVSIEAGGAPIGSPAPLDATTAEIDATRVWQRGDSDEQPLSGHGITVCNIDAGIDVFHPLFFRADGGYHVWRDVDGNRTPTPGVDQVVVNGESFPLGIIEAQILGRSDGAILGSSDPTFSAGLDWLYADTNGNGVRDFGRGAGFDDATPSFGEQLLSVDDVNGNDTLDVGEKLVALGSSKIRAVVFEDTVYRRGHDLIDAPRGSIPNHGTAASSVIIAGTRGLTRFVGVAPDAELIMAIRTDSSSAELYALTSYCIDQGARVVLHEYAPWQGFFLDGSSALEGLIDETSAEGVAHINPAGNLSTADKLYKREHPAGQTTTIDLTVPSDEEYHYFGASVLWRGGRGLQLTLVDPTGETRLVQPSEGTTFELWHDQLRLFTERDTSSRGTTRVDVIVFGDDFAVPIDPGAWEIRVSDPEQPGAAPVEVIAYVQDDVSGWNKGLHFPEHVSEDHLIGQPGTADLAISVAAYIQHGYTNGGEPGERAWYSGRGFRIDGEEILSVSAPADPITAGWAEGQAISYRAFGGTSGASPHVAGAAALLLEAHADYTGEQARAAIRAGALVDEAVGAVPNNDYGWGKLRVYRSIYGEDPPANAPPIIAVQSHELLVGQSAEVLVQVSDAEQPGSSLRVEIDRDYDGTYEQLLSGHSYQVSFERTGHQVHKLRVVDASGAEASTLAHFEVRSASDWVAVGGCQLHRQGFGHDSWLLVGLTLLFLRPWRRQQKRRSQSRQRSRRRAPNSC